MKTQVTKAIFVGLWLSASLLSAQSYPEGIWQGYDGEWKHVSQQLVALAEATPAEKFAWRPAAGVRSTSEVYMHIAMANFYLLSVTGPKMPAASRKTLRKQLHLKRKCSTGSNDHWRRLKRRIWPPSPPTWSVRCTSLTERRRWTECIFVSSFMRMKHGPADRVRAHDWRRAAVVEELKMRRPFCSV
jgi:hypothetical protein